MFSNPVQKTVLAIALPMIISNLSIPLLALVDTAVVGHLEHPWYLGGVALGSTLISLVFLLLGFLRMSTTGLTAQALGANDVQAQIDSLLKAALVAIVLAGLILLMHPLILPIVHHFSTASAQVLEQTGLYFQIRIWSAPATLLNMVLLGWFLGLHNARYPMWLLIFNQSLNILLDLLFVLGFGWKVAGVAAASVIAEYSTLLLGLVLVVRLWRQHGFPVFQLRWLQRLQGYRVLLGLNRDIFIRSLCLQAVFTFIAFRGASFGDHIVAANAVLLSFLMLVSYALDGFAYAAETTTGRAVGAKDQSELLSLFKVLASWGLFLACTFSLLFWLVGTPMIALLTSIDTVRLTAADYLPWLVALPFFAVWSYLLDGVYIGATKAKAMRNSMLFALIGFVICYLLLYRFDNHALWFSLSFFMLLRSVTLGLPLYCQGINQVLLKKTP